MTWLIIKGPKGITLEDLGQVVLGKRYAHKPIGMGIKRTEHCVSLQRDLPAVKQTE